MPRATTTAQPPTPALLRAARGGDEDAFRRLVEPYRGELHAHAYRMLGSVHDAEDALQDALLRAWKALGRFEERASLRSWLYTIATNTCLTQIGKRPKRVLPVDFGPATDPHAGPGEPLVESVWVEPYPDEELGLQDGLAGPDARYEQRESIELAFVVALQHLPATQRAVLILREVLVAMLARDATFAMPPLASWFGPRDQIETFLAGFPLSGAWRWRALRTRANGQEALAFYAWDEEAGAHLPFALNVLTFRGREISDVVAFVTRSTQPEEREAYHRWVDQPHDDLRLQSAFARFGLPERVE
jgi:RNA polymerase sigma factor (sigma-70 family)